MAGLRFGVDVGGTFTDVVAYDESGGLRSLKLPTTPSNQAESILDGVRTLLGREGAIGVVHGTTVVTNALLEGRVGNVALVTTEGFRDVLEIARLARSALYELVKPGKPAPLVPRHRRLVVAERVRHDGSVALPLDEQEIARVVAEVGALGADAVAICLLHSYANPEHEQRLAQALADAVPHVCTSSDVNAELREFERTSTTTLNAAVMPVAARYVERLERALAEDAPSAPLHIVQSNGGMMSGATASRLPLRMVMSGPAAGVAAAQHLLRGLGVPNAVTFDMGGTSTDVCLISRGVLETVQERKLNGWPVRMPSVAVESIGAGGGSVATLDPTGALRVGPRSAGARPGPASYGLGGVEPTVTDANVVLGLIRHGLEFGGGAVVVDRKLAERALAQIAGPLGMTVPEAARGVVEIANANMLRAIRLVTVQRGVDPRDLTLVAYGGAGPLHAARLAQLLGTPRVLVPAFSSAFSALGCLTSELRYDVVQTFRRQLEDVTAEDLDGQFRRLAEAATVPLVREGHAVADVELRRSVDLRYAGQNYELEIALAPGRAGLEYRSIRERFSERHRARYTYATDEPLECVTLRVAALVPSSLPRPPERRPSGPAQVADDQPCLMPGVNEVRATVYRRAGLAADQALDGPALIEDEQSTIVVPPGQRARADAIGNLIVEAAEP